MHVTQPAPRARDDRAEGSRLLAYSYPLDGLRALSIVAVMLVHSGFRHALGGGIGVSLFFVLSGYLITTLLLREQSSTGTVRLGWFWLRRALRLLPALGLSLAGGVLVALTLTAPERLDRTLSAVPYVLLYVGNLAVAFTNESLGLFGPYWSLAVEEQFYLVWPVVLAYLLVRRRAALTHVLAGVLVVTIALEVHRFLAAPDLAHLSLLARTDFAADLLLFGATLALAAHRWGDRVLHVAGRVAPLALAYVLVWVIALDPLHVSPGRFTLLVTVGHLGVGLSGVALVAHLASGRQDGLLIRAASLRPVVYVGQISYGLYLWHRIVFDAVDDNLHLQAGVQLTLKLGLSVLVAGLSHRYVERPLLRRFRPLVDPSHAAVPAARA
jgi:peptidoglycan/LPS O-acetylase OafA/YrhL